MSGKNLPLLWNGVGVARNPGSPAQPGPGVFTTTRRADRTGPETSGLAEVDPRVTSLQRSVQFLQQQHQDTLEKLHAEIEHLRQENKELKYKSIMESHKASKKGVLCGLRGARPHVQGREAHAGFYLAEPLEEPSILLQDQVLSLREGGEAPRSVRQNGGGDVTAQLIASLRPLRIRSSPSRPPRAPTLQECEVIVRQLFNANSVQSQEITRVKGLLRDMVVSKKITPEHHILSKAYLVGGACEPVEENTFPKLGLQSFSEKASRPCHSRLVLPALKQNLNSSVTSRQGRTRAVHRPYFKWTFQ